MYTGSRQRVIVRSIEAQKMFDFRRINNMTLSELSQKIGINITTLHKFESRESPKPVQWMIFACCREVGLDFSEFKINIPKTGRFIRHKQTN
jgi:DNA-binding XRE family transcriptional regulator